MALVNCTPKEETAQAGGGVGSTQHPIEVTCLGPLSRWAASDPAPLPFLSLQGGSPHSPLDRGLPVGRVCAFMAEAKEPSTVPGTQEALSD